MQGMTCDHCMYQRYVMTPEGQAWFCRRQFPRWYHDGVMELHHEDAKEVSCIFEKEE